MTKIEFLDNNEPPLSADNLNAIQTNTENAIGVVQDKVDSLEPLLISSLSEQVVGEWIDGKPLYRKVINFGAGPNNTTRSVAHNITNLKKIIHLSGFGQSTLNNGGITLPHASPSPIALYADNTNVTLNSQQNATAYNPCYIWIEYTKTTD